MDDDTIKPDQAAIVLNKDGTVQILMPKEETVSDNTIVAVAVANAITDNDKRIQSIINDFLNQIEVKASD